MHRPCLEGENRLRAACGAVRRHGGTKFAGSRWRKWLLFSQAGVLMIAALGQPQLAFNPLDGIFDAAFTLPERDFLACREPMRDFLLGRQDRAMALAA